MATTGNEAGHRSPMTIKIFATITWHRGYGIHTWEHGIPQVRMTAPYTGIHNTYDNTCSSRDLLRLRYLKIRCKPLIVAHFVSTRKTRREH